MRDFTPRPYQSQAIRWIAERDRCALWAGMGMGKTSTTLGVIDLGLMTGDTLPTLVIAPLRVARDTWPAEVRKWRQFNHLEVSPIVGDVRARAAALKRDVPIYSINYENLPWLIDHLGNRWSFGRIVADESTRLKNTRIARLTKRDGTPYWRHAGGQRSRALGRKSHKTPKFLELTGTPSPNGVIDLWGQLWHIDMGERLGYSFEAFTRRWYSKKLLSDGGVQYDPHPHAQAEIQHLLRDICLTLDPRDWFDLREPVHNIIHVELPKKARAIYREMEREMFAVIGGRGIEAVNAAAKTMKCLQLANGAAYVDEKAETFEVLHDEKLDALESVLEEAGGAPVLCAYHFRSDLARIVKRFPDAIDVATAEGLRAAQAGQGRLWIGHPASMGHGIDGLQEHCCTAAFFGHWWDLEQRQQFIERIGPVRQAQAGKDRAVFIHDIVARATVDEIIIARHATKRGVQDLLLEAMKA